MDRLPALVERGLGGVRGTVALDAGVAMPATGGGQRGAGRTVVYHDHRRFFALKSAELVKLMRDAEEGGSFARELSRATRPGA